MLVLVINYTGDRIHFGLATERAREEGLKVGPAFVAFSAWSHALIILYVFGMVFVRCPLSCHLYFLYAKLDYFTVRTLFLLSDCRLIYNENVE